MITKEQREERKKFIGSSDVAALFGLDPFKTSADVYAEKVFTIAEPNTTSDSIKIGNRHESACVDFVREALGVSVVTDPKLLRFICPDHQIFACNLDAYTASDFMFQDTKITNENVIIEAKTTGLADEWGEPGTDEAPYRVLLQVHHQMLCTGWDKAVIVVLMGKFGLREELYYVRRNKVICDAIIEKCTDFWNGHVKTKIPPPDSIPANIDLFSRIERIPESFAEVPDEVIRAWDEARRVRLDAEKAEKEAKARMLLDLGDAEAAKLSNGDMLTYYRQSGRDILDATLLRQKYPDIYTEVAKPNSYPVLRIKKAK